MLLITAKSAESKINESIEKTRSELRGEGHEINSIHAREQDCEIIGRTRLEAGVFNNVTRDAAIVRRNNYVPFPIPKVKGYHAILLMEFIANENFNLAALTSWDGRGVEWRD